MLLLTARAGAGSPIPPVLAGLLARGVGTRLDLAPLTLDQAMDLLAERYPDLTRSTAERLWTVSGGLPFSLLESARAAAAPTSAGIPTAGGTGGSLLATAVGTLPSAARSLVERLAVLGMDASTDEVLALADGPEQEAFAAVEAAVDALLLVAGDTGYSVPPRSSPGGSSGRHPTPSSPRGAPRRRSAAGRPGGPTRPSGAAPDLRR